MTDLAAIIGLAQAINIPLLGLLTWLVWRIYSNHLPHFQKSLNSLNKRLARMEGRQEERDAAS